MDKGTIIKYVRRVRRRTGIEKIAFLFCGRKFWGDLGKFYLWEDLEILEDLENRMKPCLPLEWGTHFVLLVIKINVNGYPLLPVNP